jgi:hypothetical protein
VFACGGHAELERLRGKWLCLQSAALAVANGAGIGTSAPQPLAIDSSAELEDRLPAIAQATTEDRAFFRSGPGEGWLHAQPGRLQEERQLHVGDPELLGDALGIARFIERTVRERAAAEEGDLHAARFLFRPEPRRAAGGRPASVPGLLGELLAEAPA